MQVPSGTRAIIHGHANVMSNDDAHIMNIYKYDNTLKDKII